MMNNHNILNNNSYTIGKAVIDETYHTKSADEEFFRYFGNDVTYSIQRTIHKDDFEHFKNSLSNINNGEYKKIVIRMKGVSTQYRWVIAVVKRIDDSSSNVFFNITLNDILSLESLVYEREYLISEYRHLLSMVQELAFNYNFDTKIIKIFFFDCYREIPFISEDINTFRENSISQKYIRPEYINTFNKLCDDIQNGVYQFSYEVESNFLTYGKNYELNLFKGVTRFDDIEHKKVTGVISSIPTKNKSKDNILAIESIRDSVSELFNKRYITDYAQRCLAKMPKMNVNIAIVDIDDFAQINSTYGHLFGDEVIFTLSNIIKAEIGTRGIAGRIGGGCFQIILEGTNDETDLRGILRAIRTKTERSFQERFENLIVTCSIGVSTYPIDSKNYDELFMQADKALYLAKIKGKNRYVIYDINKHGPVEKDLENKIAYISYFKNENLKLNFIGSITDRIIFEDIPDITSLLEEIKTQFSIDSICIFSSPSMNEIISVGSSFAVDAAYALDSEYIQRFDGDKVLIIDNVNELEGRADVAFNALTNQNILGTLQYLITDDDDNIIGLISYNYINRFKKWSVTDANYLTILSRIISAILKKSNIT